MSLTGLCASEHGVCVVSVDVEMAPVFVFLIVVVTVEVVQQLTLSG